MLWFFLAFLVIESGSSCVFNVGDNVDDGVIPCVTVISKGELLVRVRFNMTGTKGFFQTVLKLLGKNPIGSNKNQIVLFIHHKLSYSLLAFVLFLFCFVFYLRGFLVGGFYSVILFVCTKGYE